MLRDVFYFGNKPNVHPREKFAKSLADARFQCTTEHFWVINEFCDYRNFDWDFDFEYLPDEEVWAEDHINIWPSQWQKDSGTWLCSKNESEIKIYRADVDVVKRKNEINEYWILKDKINKKAFDFSWHPDPASPPYIYIFGNQHYDAYEMSTVEYHVPGATDKKFVTEILAELSPDPELFECLDIVDDFDYTWRPHPNDPPYIYVWGSQHHDPITNPTVLFMVKGATQPKYMYDQRAKIGPTPEKFETLHKVSEFDYSWRPNPNDPPYIYIWGNQWYDATVMPTVKYTVDGASEIKYMTDQVAKLAPQLQNFEILDVVEEFDFSWVPDPKSPPYIYVFGNQWHDAITMPTVRYYMEGATQEKYITDIVAKLAKLPHKFITHIKVEHFDYSWKPNPNDPPYIYIFGNNMYPAVIMPTIEYHVPGATEKKFVASPIAELAQKPEDFEILEPIEDFNFSWIPDPKSPPYIYVWGNQWNSPEKKASVIYKVKGATEFKYMENRVTRLPDMKNWYIPVYCNVKNFDFSWEPDPSEPPYIYEFGTQWQKTGGPQYIVPGATEKKYVDVQKCIAKPYNFRNWSFERTVDLSKFDFSWHPDNTEKPYIYQFPTQHQKTGGPRFIVEGATEVKYVNDQVSIAIDNKEKNWVIPSNLKQNEFDFSWHPDSTEEPYIYIWGNKWIPGELEPTVEYRIPNATKIKYMENNAPIEIQFERWTEHQPIDKTKFDLTWRPDPREPAYIYVWGNKWIPGELQPTLEYKCPGATEIKYMSDLIEVLPNSDRWVEHQKIDKTKFDMSWRPDPREPPYIYIWGNKHISGEIKPTLEYRCKDASDIKYMPELLEVLPEMDKWIEVQQIDRKKFDLTWRPDPREPPFIYVWGNKYIPGELKSTIEYHCIGATDKKYIQTPVDILPEQDKWKVIQQVTSDFDYTWRPDPREPAYIYVWGNKHIPGELKSTIEYHCPNSTEKKYMGNVEVEPEHDRWKILVPVDKNSFDFTWRPDPREPAYIYVFGNKQYDAEIEPTIEYHCEGATERKYINTIRPTVLPNLENWKTLIPVTDFDFTWRPDPNSPPYIYVFGNQWNDAATEPTLEYHVPGATDKKYVNDIVATTTPINEYWHKLIDIEKFDYSWRPNPHSAPYIYVFGNQWNDAIKEPTIEFRMPGATDKKYITDIIAIVKSTSTENHWRRLISIDRFDYSWRPDPNDPPYIYVFGNQWNDATTEPSIEYHVKGATTKKYIDRPVAIPQADFKYWTVFDNNDLETFDFSWRPNPYSPPQIYQWPDNGPRYTVPNATEIVLVDHNFKSTVKKYYIKTTLEDLIQEHIDEVFWALNPELTYENFDFKWKPDNSNFKFINVFGNKYGKNTRTYYVNGPLYKLGYKDLNYVEDTVIETTSNLSMFFVDRGNSQSQDRYQRLVMKYPKLQKTRYLNSWVDTINRCCNKSETKLFWVLSSELNYEDFEFDFYPSTWQENMVHVFGTQWNHWGNTYLINKEKFPEDTKFVKIIEHLSCLNFVKTKKALASDILHDIIYIDHGNKFDFPENATVIKYDQSYIKTFKNLLSVLPSKKEHYAWLISSVCDYSEFDFSYICDPFARDQLHVFPSNKQKFGDTFFVNVNKLRELLVDTDKLEDYNQVNYNNHLTAKRLESPKFIIDNDTFSEVGKIDYDFPYADFITIDNSNIHITQSIPMSLWSQEHKNIVIHSTGGTHVTIPKVAKEYINYELYDYPNIIRDEKLTISRPLDIVFLSNGEDCAEENWEHLKDITENLPNRVVRVDGINGRTQAYHAAAQASETPWMFTVFAKLRVNPRFDFSWQPDRLQVPKHYIFVATNPVNRLEYGHQAMIAYNKKLTLANKGVTLDFTLGDEHEVVDINSGVAMFNTDPFSTWRTAFREAIKLKYINNHDSLQRLETWLTSGEGPHSEYSILGSKDALEYFNDVEGNIDKLKLSYEWAWLKTFFDNKYSN